MLPTTMRLGHLVVSAFGSRGRCQGLFFKSLIHFSARRLSRSGSMLRRSMKAVTGRDNSITMTIPQLNICKNSAPFFKVDGVFTAKDVRLGKVDTILGREWLLPKPHFGPFYLETVSAGCLCDSEAFLPQAKLFGRRLLVKEIVFFFDSFGGHAGDQVVRQGAPHTILDLEIPINLRQIKLRSWHSSLSS